MKSKIIIACLLALCSATQLLPAYLILVIKILLDERRELDTLILRINLLGIQALREVIEKVLPLLTNFHLSKKSC